MSSNTVIKVEKIDASETEMFQDEIAEQFSILETEKLDSLNCKLKSSRS